MKKTFLTTLPLVAAVILAASCGEDNDNEPEVQPAPEPVVSVEESNTVVIPFRVGVESGESLSKISYIATGSETKVTRVFEQSDVDNNLTMTVTGTGITASTLTLKVDDAGVYFEGDIKVESGKESDFTNGKIDLTGTFGTALTTPTSSTSSLKELMESCSHQYKADFKSDDESISLVDQNAYLYFKCADSQTKFVLTVGDGSATYTPNATTHKIWIAVPGGATVKGNLVSKSGKTAAAGHVITIDRTDVVDLNLSDGLLWMTHNLGATNPGEYGNYYAWGDTQGYTYTQGGSNNHDFSSSNYSIASFSDAATTNLGETYRMPTSAELTTLSSCSKEWETQNSHSGYKFYTDYGSVFLPAAGCCTGTDRDGVGTYGYYWSSSPFETSYALYLYFYSSYARVSGGDRHNGLSVRAVRCN